MTKQDLDRVFNRGIVVTFNNRGEENSFLKEVKELGGKWFNGKEIKYNENALNSKAQPIAHKIAIDRNYQIGYVSAMCYHFGAYPTVQYHKFKTDKCTIDLKDVENQK